MPEVGLALHKRLVGKHGLERPLALAVAEEIRQQREQLRMDAERVLAHRVRHQPARLVEERRANGRGQPAALAPPARRQFRFAGGEFHVLRVPHRHEVEEVEYPALSSSGGAAAIRNRAVPPFGHPVDEAPSGGVRQQPVFGLVRLKPEHRVAEARKPRLQPLRVGVEADVVAHEQRPEQRPSGGVLRDFRRPVHRHGAVRTATVVEHVHRAPHQPVVRSHARHGAEVHHRVAGIHLLLVARAVHRDVVRAHLQTAQAQGRNAGEVAALAFERRFHLQRIARLDDGRGGKLDRLRPRLHRDAAPAPAPPPRRREHGAVASVANERVLERQREVFAGELPAIALLVAHQPLAPRMAKRLHPAPFDLGALSAADLQLGIPAPVVAKIPQHFRARAGRERKRRRG